MLWSSFSTGGYTTGIAISDSGKLAGPWRQQAEPIYTADGKAETARRSFQRSSS